MDLNFPKIEEKILKFWKENKIFEKSIEKRKKRPILFFMKGRRRLMLNQAFIMFWPGFSKT